jgi:tetratricopeptide (TPR) repeat protein
MKSDHRHELKTNALADWMTHIPEWSKKNTKPLIGGTALVVLVVVAALWSQYNNTVLAEAHRSQFTSSLADQEAMIMQVAQSNTQGDDASMILGESSVNLATLAKNASSDTMAALAYLKQAEMLREQIQFENGQTTQETITDRIETAKAAYNNALKKGTDSKTLMSLAHYGLGLCAEELGQFKEAATIYDTLIADTSLDGTLGKASAVNRIKSMTYFDGVISFPIVEVVPEPLLPRMPQILDSNSVTPSTEPVIGPALPAAEPPVAAPNTVPAADANVTQ